MNNHKLWLLLFTMSCLLSNTAQARVIFSDRLDMDEIFRLLLQNETNLAFRLKARPCAITIKRYEGKDKTFKDTKTINFKYSFPISVSSKTVSPTQNSEREYSFGYPGKRPENRYRTRYMTLAEKTSGTTQRLRTVITLRNHGMSFKRLHESWPSKTLDLNSKKGFKIRRWHEADLTWLTTNISYTGRYIKSIIDDNGETTHWQRHKSAKDIHRFAVDTYEAVNKQRLLERNAVTFSAYDSRNNPTRIQYTPLSKTQSAEKHVVKEISYDYCNN